MLCIFERMCRVRTGELGLRKGEAPAWEMPCMDTNRRQLLISSGKQSNTARHLKQTSGLLVFLDGHVLKSS